MGFVVPLYTISAHDGYPGAWVGKTQDMEQEALGWSQVGFQHQLSDSVNLSVFREHLSTMHCAGAGKTAVNRPGSFVELTV